MFRNTDKLIILKPLISYKCLYMTSGDKGGVFMATKKLAIDIQINRRVTNIFKFIESVTSKVSWQRRVPIGQRQKRCRNVEVTGWTLVCIDHQDTRA